MKKDMICGSALQVLQNYNFFASLVIFINCDFTLFVKLLIFVNWCLPAIKVCLKKQLLVVKTNFRSFAQFTKFTKISRVRKFVVLECTVLVTCTSLCFRETDKKVKKRKHTMACSISAMPNQLKLDLSNDPLRPISHVLHVFCQLSTLQKGRPEKRE